MCYDRGMDIEIKDSRGNIIDVKSMRLKLGLSQKELASRLKVDVITISRWERNLQKPDKTAAKRLTRIANKNKEGA